MKDQSLEIHDGWLWEGALRCVEAQIKEQHIDEDSIDIMKALEALAWERQARSNYPVRKTLINPLRYHALRRLTDSALTNNHMVMSKDVRAELEKLHSLMSKR